MKIDSYGISFHAGILRKDSGFSQYTGSTSYGHFFFVRCFMNLFDYEIMDDYEKCFHVLYIIL
ncbi:hypothetical protein DWX43_18045 [Clostridium sp. AF19-22AC]|nr:hypothetical protein DWX43_18045 [Clostridium sp. AF19-22AC]